MPRSRSTSGQMEHSSALQKEPHDMIHQLASSSDSNDEHTLYHKYRSLSLLKRWLRKVLPVAQLASHQQDIEIIIEGGDRVVSAIKHLLKECDVRDRQTIVRGFFCVKMKSLTHSIAAESINAVWINIASILSPHSYEGNLLLHGLVNHTRCGTRLLHDDIVTRLVVDVNNYCSRELGSQLKVPKRVIGSKRSGLYQKAPDQSFEPGFLVKTSKATEYFPTVLCEVGMSSAVSEVIFDCLSFLAGSRCLVDLAFGIDIVIEKSCLTKIRLFTFDASIQALAELAKESHGIARVTKSKVVNRLGHLRALRQRLRNLDSPGDRYMLDHYLEFENSIDLTIQELEQLEKTIGGSDTEVTKDDIVETCRAVLHNSIVIHLEKDVGGNFKATRDGQQFDRLDVPVEPFLMLRLGREFRDHVTLSVEDMRRLFYEIKGTYQATNLEKMESFVPLRLTKKDISGNYDEFVRLHENDEGFDVKAFERGDPTTVQKVSLRHLDDERGIRPLGQEYLAIIRGVENCSRALVLAAALHKLVELHGDGVREYNLASLPRRPHLNGKEYWNEFMDIYPDAPGHIQEYFRRILNNEGIRNFLGIDENRRALIGAIRKSGSLTAFLGDLGEDERNARNWLIDVIAGNSDN